MEKARLNFKTASKSKSDVLKIHKIIENLNKAAKWYEMT
jgi:hypothetical protein